VRPLSQESSPSPRTSRQEAIKYQVVHQFALGDVEDPEIYAGHGLWEFQQSEKGQWVMATAVETPVYTIAVDHAYYGYQVKIAARLYESDLTYFLLKWR
jgi:hypothetical protein